MTILQAFIRADVLTVESHALDEFGQPSRLLTRRAPVSAALRAALDAQIAELDGEQADVEAKARAEIAAGKKLDRAPVADLVEKEEKRKIKDKEDK